MSTYLLFVVWFGISLTPTESFLPEASLQWWEYESDGVIHDRVFLELPDLEYDSEDDDSTWFSPHDLRTNSMLLDFLAVKGCRYLSGYVHTMVQHQPRTHHSDSNRTVCDWNHWAMKQCRLFHIAPEMCTALIECNASTTLMALNAPPDMYQPCNVSYDESPLFGKRQLSSTTHGEEMTNEGSSNSHDSVGSMRGELNHEGSEDHADDRYDYADPHTFQHHSGPDQKGQYPDWFRSLLLNTQSISPQLTTLVTKIFESYYKTEYGEYMPMRINSPPVDHYCRYYSRHLQTVYHFEQFPRSTWSKNWLTDVYTLSARANMPPHLAHGLVGCGMTYARDAMDLKPRFNYFLSRYQR